MRIAALTFMFVAFGVSADSNYYCKAADIANSHCNKGDAIYVTSGDALRFCDLGEQVITINGANATYVMCMYRGEPRNKRDK